MNYNIEDYTNHMCDVLMSEFRSYSAKQHQCGYTKIDAYMGRRILRFSVSEIYIIATCTCIRSLGKASMWYRMKETDSS
jgi:hypothetical protein